MEVRGIFWAAPHKFSPPPVSTPGPDGVVPDARLAGWAPDLASEACANSGALAIARLPLACGAYAEGRGGRDPLLTSARSGNWRTVVARSASANGTLAGINAGDAPQSAAGVRQVAAKGSREGGREPDSIRFKVSCGDGPE